MLYLFLVFLGLLVSGCAPTAVYDPLAAATSQTLLLNEGALKDIRPGMSMDEVHHTMGDVIVVGYTSDPGSSTYKPLTISNPYKAQELLTSQGTVIVEYYVSSVHQPDGIISDNELVPFVFKNNVLLGFGWSFLKSLH